MFEDLLRWARALKRDVMVLYVASSDPRVPWYVKLLAGCVVAYALSPIDLIPDFIPVVGYLDDAVIVPIGIVCVLKLIPKELLAEFRAEAELRPHRLPVSRAAAAVIVGLWVFGAGLAVRWFWHLIRSS